MTAFDGGSRLRLRPGTSWRRDERFGLVLETSLGSGPVRISAAAEPLLPLLAEGCQESDLADVCRSASVPDGAVHGQVRAFVDSLMRLGVLEGSEAPVRSRRRKTISVGAIEPALRPLIRLIGLHPRSLAIVVGTWLGIAIAALVFAMLTGAIDNPLDALIRRDWRPFAIAVLAVPLHELGHIVAAAAAGVRLGNLRFERIGVLFYRPSVETLSLASETARYKIALVAAAGPATDLLVSGTSAGISLTTAGDLQVVAGGVAAITLLFFYRGLNPWKASDGSRFVSCLVGDPSLRRRAVRIPWSAVPLASRTGAYRAWAVVYAGGGAGLLAAMVLQVGV